VICVTMVELHNNFTVKGSKRTDDGTLPTNLEYYGGLGPISHIDPFREQGQQIFPSIDLDPSPDWEFNFGVGVGMTGGSDHLIVKMIVGRRFVFKKK
jgi:hypothetical protein